MALAIGLALASIPVSAHLVIPADFRDVVNDASLIIRGRATDVRSVVVPGSGIDSIVTFAVENVLKGTASGFVYVRVPGGVSGRTRFVMVGAPTFKTGQRAVLFLKPSIADVSFRPIGLTMGVYPIQPDPATQKLVVQPPVISTRGIAVVPPQRGDRDRKPMEVPEFESLVRTVMSAKTGQPIPKGGK